MFSRDLASPLRVIDRLGALVRSGAGLRDGLGSRAEAHGLGACLPLEYQKSSVAQPMHFAKPRVLRRVHLLKSFGVNQQFSLKGMTYGVADDFWYASQGGHPMRHPRNRHAVTATQ